MTLPTTSVAFSLSTPAAPAGDQDVVFQSDGGTPQQKISAYPQRATASLCGTVKPDGTSVTIAPDGTISSNQSSDTAFIEAVQQESYVFGLDAGTANAYAVAQNPPPTIVQGSAVVFLAANANTGASTLAVNGGTATPITKTGSVALSGGEILANQVVIVVYDGVEFQIVGGGGGGGGANGGAPSPVVPSGAINGSNVNFTIPAAGAGNLYLDGVLQNAFGSTPDYTISGVNITMAVAPVSSPKTDWMVWVYLGGSPGPPGPPGSNVYHDEPLTDGNANFIFAATLAVGGDIIVATGVPN